MSDEQHEAQPNGGTFTRGDIQVWIDTLTDREQAMFRHALVEAEMRAVTKSLGAAADSVAALARDHQEASRDAACRAVREVAGLLMRLQLVAVNSAREFSGEAPILPRSMQ
jgi:hypothetical protein